MKKYFISLIVILSLSPLISFFLDCPSVFKFTSCTKIDNPLKNYNTAPEVDLNNSEAVTMSFIAYGDMPYFEKNYKSYEELIIKINTMKPSLVIHTGDAHHPNDCDNKTINLMYNYMNKIDAPLFFVLGDNDWTDCPKTKFTQAERLNYVRKIYFSSASTLGRQPIKVINQKDLGYPENSRFKKNNIGFVGLHVVGSKNNMVTDDPKKMSEFNSRNKANLTWLNESFNLFNQTDAIVIVLHGNMLKMKRNPFRKLYSTLKKDIGLIMHLSTYQILFEDIFIEAPYYSFKLPYKELGTTIQNYSQKYRRPVLLLHGDTHKHKELKPTKNYPNLYVIETHGTPDIKAARIAIRPKSNYPFKVEEVIEPK